MNLRIVEFAAVAILSLTFPGVSGLVAQQTLPIPGKDNAALIKILESDGPEYEKAKACQQLAIVGESSAVPALAALLSDEQLSSYARSALENMPGGEADEALRFASSKLAGRNLLGVIESMGKRRRPEAISTLKRFLNLDDSPNCVAAARAIAQIGTAAAIPPLEEAVSNATGELQLELAKASLICAQRLIAQGENTTAVPFCEKIIGSELPKSVKLAAAYQKILALGKGGTIELLNMFDNDDSEQFEMALYAARRMVGNANIAESLASKLKSLTPERQILLLTLLADQSDKRVLPFVLQAAKTDDAGLRVAAINVISKLGDEGCLPVLLEALASTDEPVVDAAVAAAVSIDAEQIDDAAIKMLDSDNPQTILSGMKIVAGRRLVSAFEQLNGLRRHQNDQIRKQAVYALGQVATADQLDQLVGLLIESNDDELFPDVQMALKSACLRMPQASSARTFAEALKNAPEKSKISLMEQLAFVGGPNALEFVVSAAKSDDDTMRDAATRVLGEWLTADAAPEIFELAKSFPKGKYQTRALRGYIRIARQLSMTMDERMEVCRNALSIADRKDEKLLVLDVLRRHRSREGIAIAESLVNEQGLTGKANSVIQIIKQYVGEDKEVGFASLFDGKTLDGWKGGDLDFWRVEDGEIVGGDLVNKVKQNEFLRTTKEYSDFELRLQFKLTGKKTNAGVQIRTAEIPDHHEVSGYQADLGDGWWGCLYDESRRRKLLAGPPADERPKPVRMDQWNDYRILCEGKRIQLWINGIQTVDYTEPDPDIPQVGIIALQVHGNLIMEARYRNVRIKTLR